MKKDIVKTADGLHIGFIMDGNGRWAKKRLLPRTAGHKRGADVFHSMVHYCEDIGAAGITFYAFSTENWKRPKNEIENIMLLFKQYLIEAYDYEKENNVVRFLGDKTPINAELREMMLNIEERTKTNTGMFLNIAINYGGRDEILMATKKLADKVKAGEINSEDITEEMISDNLYTQGQKDPDFILRPSGEKRISNFLLWQSAYSELIFLNVLWPDFTPKDLEEAVEEYNTRTRRFGGI